MKYRRRCYGPILLIPSVSLSFLWVIWMQISEKSSTETRPDPRPLSRLHQQMGDSGFAKTSSICIRPITPIILVAVLSPQYQKSWFDQASRSGLRGVAKVVWIRFGRWAGEDEYSEAIIQTNSQRCRIPQSTLIQTGFRQLWRRNKRSGRRLDWVKHSINRMVRVALYELSRIKIAQLLNNP